MNKEVILSELKKVKYPGFSRDIVSFGLIESLQMDEKNNVHLELKITTDNEAVCEELKATIQRTLQNLAEIQGVFVNIALKKPHGSVGSQTKKPVSLEKIQYTLAIASGKGGVGKSTFAVNLACAFEKILANEGIPERVGLMDCDIYGPSTPLMLGVNVRPEIEGECLLPVKNFGISAISMGMLIDEDAPVVWRGPMVMKTIQQFALNVAWGELEILIIDLPPGTGDAQLSLTQTIPLSGALIVTTPQLAATQVAVRGAKMFEKVNVPILGVAENMSFFINPTSNEKTPIFGQGGGQNIANALKTELLGQVPLDPKIRIASDSGIPIVVSDPNSEGSLAFDAIAKNLLNKLQKNKRPEHSVL